VPAHVGGGLLAPGGAAVPAHVGGGSVCLHYQVAEDDEDEEDVDDEGGPLAWGETCVVGTVGGSKPAWPRGARVGLLARAASCRG
jgi:hypothetical protein